MLELDSPLRLLWSKTDRDQNQPHPIHPLNCHLIDVAQVVRSLWDTCFPAAAKTYFADIMALDQETTGQWLAFLAGSHDLGKASPTFQGMHLPARTRLEQAGFDFPQTSKASHGECGITRIRDRISYQMGWRVMPGG